MPLRLRIRLAEIAAASLLVIALLAAWRADRRDQAQLASELAATKKALADADSRQRERDSQLADALAGLAKLKRTIATPAQIVRDLPREIPLPTPITLQSVAPVAPPAPQLSTTPTPNPQQAFIPTDDLKPLYDFALDCKACQAKLVAAQNDLSDEKTKTAGLAHERDDALRIARGGTIWRRIARATKWFAIGALAGALAAKATH